MKLKWFHVKEFQSVKDSGRVVVDDITCLVGKNEAGKSTLLKALEKLNPYIAANGKFDASRDYPRMSVEDYRLDVEQKKREHAVPIQAGFDLDEELENIIEIFGPDCLADKQFTLSKNYNNGLLVQIRVNQEAALKHLISSADFTETTKSALKNQKIDAAILLGVIAEQEETGETTRVSEILEAIKKRGLMLYIYDEYIEPALPEFLYFDEYYQMSGHENVEALLQREKSETLKSSDYPMLGLIRQARLTLSELINPKSTLDLKNRLEGASNHLTKQVLRYWSQNKHLRMTFDVRPAVAGDPEGMRTGTNIWGGVLDTRHHVTTELGSRSRGFVWFFSFLAWYSDVKRNGDNVVLLLDEPGLTLHAKAQQDLLNYFETELKPHHQLIYSTHSPFMIDSRHFDRVRVVQDASIDSANPDDMESAGTVVVEDIFAASADSLFPLQGALGYELHQTLFIGPFNLVVEGAADLLIIQAISAVLSEEGREAIDPRWTITPVGGSTKVPTFVALLGAQTDMIIATLIDSQTSDQKKIEELYKEKLLKKAHVFTFADFTKSSEADIEDMFGREFYLSLVNGEFAAQMESPIALNDLNANIPRVVIQIEEYFNKHPLKSGAYGHFRPARYFAENAKKMAKKIPADAKSRFEAAFKAVNKLLP